jgi:hypothetical protein
MDLEDDPTHEMSDIISYKLMLTNGVEIQPVHVDGILHAFIGFRWLGKDSQPPAHLRQWELARNQKTFMSSLSRVWTILGKVDWPLRGTESPSLAAESEVFRLSEAKLGSQLLTFFSDMEFYGYELKSKKDAKGLINPSDVRKAELCRPLAANWAHHRDSWDETWADALSGGLRLWSVSLVQIWLPPDGLLGDHVPTTAYALHRRGSSHQTQMLPIILFDPMVIWLVLLDMKGVYGTYRRIMTICGHSGIRFCLPGYRQSLPDVVTAQAFKGYRQNEISRRASTRPGYTRSVKKECDASMWRAWKGAVAHLLRNPRFAKAALRRGGVVWRIAMQFLHLKPIYNEASDDATIFSIGARIEWQGGELYDDILEGEEEATLLGAFMVRNTDNNAMDVRYWLFPPCRAWNNSPLAGACWTAAAEKWFNGLWQQYAALDPATSPLEPLPVPHRTLPKQVKEWVKELQTWDKSGTRVWTAV